MCQAMHRSLQFAMIGAPMHYALTWSAVRSLKSCHLGLVDINVEERTHKAHVKKRIHRKTFKEGRDLR